MTPLKEKTIRALKELLVIFLGVIMALAGENYIEYINDRASEREYLSGLLQELEASKKIYVSDRERYNHTDSAAMTLINISLTGDATGNNVCRLIQTVFQLIEPDIYKSVYDDLKSTGNLKLIQNANLRHDILTYYQREVYEEKWADDIRKTLSMSNDKWATDLLTVDEFAGRAPCDTKRILPLLKQKDVVDHLNRTRKMAMLNGASLDERIQRLDGLIKSVRVDLSEPNSKSQITNPK